MVDEERYEKEKSIMAATEENNNNNDRELWGTWEELLLVSAVNRHGTKNWDSVAMEIQNRITSSSSPRLCFLLTPHICKQRYQHLRRRFGDDDSNNTNHNDVIVNHNNIEEEEEIDAGDDTIPWLEELRKLRVAELRREVEQYDVSIVCLQSKVKKLTEERERTNQDGLKPDLATPATDDAPEKPVSGEESDRENQSFNESNSTDPKDENRDMDVDVLGKKPEAKETAVVGDLDPVTSGSKPAAREGSYNGSSETIAKDSVSQAFKKNIKPVRKRELGKSTELWESVAESKGTKESSDVQSSASPSKETRRKKEVSVSSSGDEPEADDISPAIKRISVKSSPLVKFLEIVKSSRYGSVFERRLESQETSKYKSLIKQHLDLETINKRLKAGRYSGSCSKFFRDFLLLVNNALIFFPNNSVEHSAAIELRQLISKEMDLRLRKSKPSQAPVVQPQPPAPTTIPPPSVVKSEAEPSHSLLAKPKSTLPMVACRKRSSITTKGASEKKNDKKETMAEEKEVVEQKQPDKGLMSLVEDQMVIKKGKRDKPASGARSQRTGKKHPNPIPTLNPSPSSSNKGGVAAAAAAAAAAGDDNSEKTERQKSNVNTVAKKRSVADFLNRMKTNTTSNGPLVESLKNSGNSSSNGKSGSAEQKKSNGGKSGDARKEQAKRQISSKKDSSSPAKRGVGRPPKRNASSPITPPPPSKRSKETLEANVSASRQPRKRSKRAVMDL